MDIKCTLIHSLKSSTNYTSTVELIDKLYKGKYIMKYAIVFMSKVGDFISVYHLVNAGPNGYFFIHREHKDTVIFDDKITALEYLNKIKEDSSFIRNAGMWSNEYIINNIGIREIY